MSEIEIGPARADEVRVLPEIELRAAALFSPEDLSPEAALDVTPVSDYVEAQRDGRILVARDREGRVVGFAHLTWVDGCAHLEELDVEPDCGRRGIGRRLVFAACRWASEHGSGRITLSTFRDVPWNAPFYASVGFVVMPIDGLGDTLRAIRAREAEDGLDPAKRVMMSLALPLAATD